MTRTGSLLLLAGSAEARQIAQALCAQGRSVRAVMSEPPRGPNPMPVPFEVLDAPDESGLAGAMAGAEAVIDASHGFDGAMTRAGAAAAAAMGLPFVSLRRPGWSAGEHPRWCAVRDIGAALALIEPGARVFSATGWASLPEYAGFPGAVLMLRQTARHDRPAPFDFVELVFGDPPFDVAGETALFRDLGVDTLICRNLGGMPSRPKLEAAKALDLAVILIDRPAVPAGVAVRASVAEVLDWVAAL